jgi:hypothetical protein
VVVGEPLARKPLHRETLAGLQTEYEAALALTFECLRLLGRVESGVASASDRACLRLLTPVAKLATARQAVAAASEALEGFGGAGYVEDTGLPVWLRDAQVLPIWEGTTNVLSLDVLRAVAREDALRPWADDVRGRLERLRDGPLADTAAALSAYLDRAGLVAAASGVAPRRWSPRRAASPSRWRRWPRAWACASRACGAGARASGARAGRARLGGLAARAAARSRWRRTRAARRVLSGLDSSGPGRVAQDVGEAFDAERGPRHGSRPSLSTMPGSSSGSSWRPSASIMPVDDQRPQPGS